MAKATGEPKKGERLPVYAIFGADAFLTLRALHALLDELLGPARDQMAVAEFDGETAELRDVRDDLDTPSLLAPFRVVCVREADDFVSAHREALEQYLERYVPPPSDGKKPVEVPVPTGALVLLCRTWPRTTRLFKLVEKIGRNIGCEAPRGRALIGWIADHAKRAYGCSMDYETAQRLADLIGEQLGLIDEELGKLATFVWPKTVIGVAAVEELVGASRAEKVFGIVDCIARRDARGALDLWEQVLATNKSAPFMALGGLGYGFRNVVEAKRLVAGGMSVAAAGKRCNIFGDPPQIQRRLDRFSLRQWQQFLVKLLRIDVGAKSGLGTFESGVEKFIVELCHT